MNQEELFDRLHDDYMVAARLIGVTGHEYAVSQHFFNAGYREGRRLELLTVADEFSLSLFSDLEHGVKRLNEAAAAEFYKKYPALGGFQLYLNQRIEEIGGLDE